MSAQKKTATKKTASKKAAAKKMTKAQIEALKIEAEKKNQRKVRAAAKAARALERRLQVWELRKSALSFRAIGKALGVSHEQARKDFNQILTEVQDRTLDQAEEIRALEIERLDTLQTGIWTKAIKGDIKAIETILKIMERRAKLAGIDRPLKIDIEADIRQMAEEQGIDPEYAVSLAKDIERQYHQRTKVGPHAS